MNITLNNAVCCVAILLAFYGSRGLTLTQHSILSSGVNTAWNVEPTKAQQAPRKSYKFILQRDLEFSNIDEREEMLVLRFFELHNVDGYIVTGQPDKVILGCDEGKAQVLLDRLKVEFGLDVSKRTFEGLLKLPFERMKTVPTSPLSAQMFIGTFATDSLIRKAYVKSVELRRIDSGSRISSCSYSYRPWLTKDLKRTQAVSGSFGLVKDGKTVNVDFFFPD